MNLNTILAIDKCVTSIMGAGNVVATTQFYRIFPRLLTPRLVTQTW